MRHRIEKEKKRKLSKEEKLTFRDKVSTAIHDYLTAANKDTKSSTPKHKEQSLKAHKQPMTSPKPSPLASSKDTKSSISKHKEQQLKVHKQPMASPKPSPKAAALQLTKGQKNFRPGLSESPVPKFMQLAEKREKEKRQKKIQKFTDSTKMMDNILSSNTPTGKPPPVKIAVTSEDSPWLSAQKNTNAKPVTPKGHPESVIANCSPIENRLKFFGKSPGVPSPGVQSPYSLSNQSQKRVTLPGNTTSGQKRPLEIQHQTNTSVPFTSTPSKKSKVAPKAKRKLPTNPVPVATTTSATPAIWPMTEDAAFPGALPFNCKAVTDKLPRRRVPPPSGKSIKGHKPAESYMYGSHALQQIPVAVVPRPSANNVTTNAKSTAEIVGPVSRMTTCPVCSGMFLIVWMQWLSG